MITKLIFNYTININHATAPGYTATRALRVCLQCNERFMLAINKKPKAKLSY